MDISIKKAHHEQSKLKRFPGAIPFILSICCIERFTASSIVGKIALNGIKKNILKGGSLQRFWLCI